MVTKAVPSERALPVVNAESSQVHVNRRLWIIVALLTVYIIWGTTYLGIRIALESFPPYLLMGIRFVLAGGGLMVFLRLRGVTMPTRRQWRGAIIVGTLLFVGGMGSVAVAEQSVSSGLAAMLVATAPVGTMLISMFWGHRPGRFEWIGVGLGLVGVGLLTLEGNLQANPGGVALMLFATLCWSLGSVLSGHLEMPKGAMGTAAEMLSGGVLMVVLGLALGERMTALPTVPAFLTLIYLVTFGSLATISAYMYLLKTVQPSLATSYAFVNPAIALVLGVVLGGEHITGSAIIALPIILAGVAVVALRRKSSAQQDSH